MYIGIINPLVSIAGDAPAHARQQGADAGADGGEQDVEQESRAAHGERQTNGQVEDDGEGGSEDGHPVHDRPRRVGEGRTNTGLRPHVWVSVTTPHAVFSMLNTVTFLISSSRHEP